MCDKKQLTVKIHTLTETSILMESIWSLINTRSPYGNGTWNGELWNLRPAHVGLIKQQKKTADLKQQNCNRLTIGMILVGLAQPIGCQKMRGRNIAAYGYIHCCICWWTYLSRQHPSVYTNLLSKLSASIANIRVVLIPTITTLILLHLSHNVRHHNYALRLSKRFSEPSWTPWCTLNEKGRHFLLSETHLSQLNH